MGGGMFYSLLKYVNTRGVSPGRGAVSYCARGLRSTLK